MNAQQFTNIFENGEVEKEASNVDHVYIQLHRLLWFAIVVNAHSLVPISMGSDLNVTFILILT